MYDVIIIGTGPAGFAAGIYAGRRQMKALVVGETLGGQLGITHLIENYPGIEGMAGMELAEIMKKQVEKFGTKVKFDKVVKIELKGDVKKVWIDNEEHQAKTVILATGAQHRKLNIEGEDKYINKGVVYCATCDGPLFRDQTVAIVGGSDAAMMAAMFMDKIAKKLYIIHRRQEFRAEETNVESAKKKNIEFILDTVVKKIEGDGKKVTKILLENVKTKEEKWLEVDGVFIEVGQIPTVEIAKQAGLEIDEKGFINVNKKQETNLPGVYAAGDVTGGIQQVVTAAGEGAFAAMQAYFYINQTSKKIQEKFKDWGVKK